MIHHIDKLENKIHMITSIDAEKTFEKFKSIYDRKKSQQSGYRGNIPLHNKGHI